MEEFVQRVVDFVRQIQGEIGLEQLTIPLFALVAISILAVCLLTYRIVIRRRRTERLRPVAEKGVAELQGVQAGTDSREAKSDEGPLVELPSGDLQIAEALEIPAASTVAELVEVEKVSEKVEPATAMMRGMSKTRTSFLDRLKGLFGVARAVDSSTLEDLEELLILSDVGARCAASLVGEVKSAAQKAGSVDEAHVKGLLREGILKELRDVPSDHPIYKPQSGPFVVLVVGVNGVGKTTTVAKLAARFNNLGKKVLLVAADTFRAAAVAQLKEWGDRLGVQVVSGPENAKPGTVVFDGMIAARDVGADVILIDTAGRLHTKSNLMQELEGIRNAIRKHLPEAPHETVLVLDGVSGQNALSQAREFNAAVDLTGLVITKLDGTPKGGIVVAISQELKIPVYYVGVGERAEDLIPFSRTSFVDGLIGEQLSEDSMVRGTGTYGSE